MRLLTNVLCRLIYIDLFKLFVSVAYLFGPRLQNVRGNVKNIKIYLIIERATIKIVSQMSDLINACYY